jgi:hypothetical protein
LASLVSVLAGSLLLAGTLGCGGSKIEFRYPGEEADFSLPSADSPRIFVDVIRDLRPQDQREGKGRFFGISYPADERWDRPVVQIYRAALVQDLTQTRLVELVPLLSQADYTLSMDIVSLGARLQRNVLNFILPVGVGMGLGMAIGSDTSSGVKTGAVLGAVFLMAAPTPTRHAAECEVKMTLRDRQGEIVWERACLGLVDDDIWVTATARDDQGWTDKYLTTAVKRCNACLLGQLRQALVDEGY